MLDSPSGSTARTLRAPDPLSARPLRDDLLRDRPSGSRLLRGDLLHDDRGDVPGWVLITLMTAGLVIVIWALAGPALSGVFEQAIERVTSF